VHQHMVGAKNVMLITTGSLVGEAIKASTDLEKKGVGSIVVNLNSLNKLNLSALKPLVKKCEGRIVTVEDHQVLLGLGAFVSHQLVQSGEFITMKSLGVHGEFGQSAYNAIDLYRKHKMDSSSIAKAAIELLG
jgi:transketolase